MTSFDWVPFHTELADTLLLYRNKRAEMIQKIIQVYHHASIKMPKLDSFDIPADMDPFTVFGLFCKGLKEQNRIALYIAIKSVFGLQSQAPTNFYGIPVVNLLNATFYAFSDDPNRGEHDIDHLWECFSTAVAYADHPDEQSKAAFIRAYDVVKDIKGNRWKLSMGLFWARPYFYLNLDSTNRSFLTTTGIIDPTFANTIKALKTVPDGQSYVDICAECNRLIAQNTGFSNIIEYSHKAWIVSKQNDSVSASGNAIADDDVRQIHYWLYAPGQNASCWDLFYQDGVLALGWSETGDARNYTSREKIKEKLRDEWGNPDSPAIYPSLAIWQLLHEMKIGDVVFVKQGRHKIIGRGIVVSDYDYVDDYSNEEYKHQRKVKWTHKGEWDYPKDSAPVKTLTDLTEYTGTVETIKSYFSDGEEDSLIDSDEIRPTYPLYTTEQFLSDVYMSNDDYTTLVKLLKKKRNVILQGAPGVGKTFAAKRLAYAMMGVKDQDRVSMVQFHQSYSYEDFIMGFRPNETGFELKKGIFYNFCKKAQDDREKDYFFIIDEINRGNLSKIFGELFMLIENDKRDIPMQLLYGDEMLSVPENVMIIGMMNTADRSLAMMDYALRRRFAFFEMIPGFATEGFRKYQQALHSEKFNALISCVENLNTAIAEDESLGDGFRIGHSYFCNLKPETMNSSDLRDIVRFELIPLLKEYWFDEPQKVKDWTAKLESAVK